MEKLKNRAVIQYLLKKGLTGKEIYTDMVDVLEDDAPSYATVKKWVADFKRGRTNITDEPRDGRPRCTTTKDAIHKVQEMILENGALKVLEIAKALNISKSCAHRILTDELGMKKLCSKWVPQKLTTETKQLRMRFAKGCLENIQADKSDFIHRLITTGELRLHYSSCGGDTVSDGSNVSGDDAEDDGYELPSKKKKIPTSTGEVTALIFWDSKGMLLIDYLERNENLTAEYYASLLKKLDKQINVKRPDLLKRGVIFYQDNFPAVHTSDLARATLDELGYTLLKHPSHSPDLYPTDFHLYPSFKKFLCGKRFSSHNEAVAAAEEYFMQVSKSHFRSGIELLETRWTKCVEVEGDYTET